MNMYETAVRRALLDVEQGLYAPEPDDSFQRYAPYEDNRLVVVNNFRQLPHVPCTAIVKQTAHSLGHLFKAYSTLTEQPLSPSFVSYYLRHESQHAACARMLGATAVWYALAFRCAEPNVRGQVFDIDGAATIVQAFHTTKLGLAIMSVYPEQPSSDDMRDAFNLGYDSARDVAERAIAYNRQGHHYPIPLSYTTGQNPQD